MFIYWLWPAFLPITMTVTHKFIKILNGHGLCKICYCDLDLWPSDLKIYMGHLMTMTNLPTKYHDCHSKTFQDIEQTSFCIKCDCDLDLWPPDLKIYRGHLLSMTNLPTKYHDCHSKPFKIMSGHDVANGRTDGRTDGQTDRQTDGRRSYHNTSEVSLRAYKNHYQWTNVYIVTFR